MLATAQMLGSSGITVVVILGGIVAPQMAPFRVLQRGLLFIAFVAVLSTLLLAGYQRRREHGLNEPS